MASGNLGETYADDGHYQEDHRQDDGELEQRLLQPASGAKGGLGVAKESRSGFTDLHEYDCHKDDGHQDLSELQSHFESHPFRFYCIQLGVDQRGH